MVSLPPTPNSKRTSRPWKKFCSIPFTESHRKTCRRSIKFWRKARRMLKEELIDRALAEIGKGYAQYQYFFDHLNSPAWLEPLAAHEFFRTPPEPKREGDYIKVAWWPESKYLVRMSRIPDVQAK